MRSSRFLSATSASSDPFAVYTSSDGMALVAYLAICLLALVPCTIDAAAYEVKLPTETSTHAAVSDGVSDGHAIEDLVLPYGYDLEEHRVTTEDGFILTLFRIPGRRRAQSAQPVVSEPLSQRRRAAMKEPEGIHRGGSSPGRHAQSASARQVEPLIPGRRALSASRQVKPDLQSVQLVKPLLPSSSEAEERLEDGGSSEAADRLEDGGSSSQVRPVVLLQHGLLDSCAGFLLLGPGRALGLMLADAGGKSHARGGGAFCCWVREKH